MTKARTFRDLFQSARAQDIFWEEWMVGDFVEALSQRMADERISRSALAAAIGATPAYVTKVLRGDTNFTVKSMAKLARAVSSVVRVHLAPVGVSTRWIDVMNGGEPEAAVNSDSKVVYVDFGARDELRGLIDTRAHASTDMR